MLQRRSNIAGWFVAGAFALEMAIPLLQFPFKNYEPQGPERGECSLPIAHTVNNFMTVFANIAGPEGVAEELYSQSYMDGITDPDVVEALERREQAYNVQQYVRSTEEMPVVTMDCYPTMITTVFALASTEVRSAIDGRMVNFDDYIVAMREIHPDWSSEKIEQQVYDFYLPR